MIDVLKPELLNNDILSSWFTLRNQMEVQADRDIAGLNLGLNTLEETRIIQENRELLFASLDLKQENVAFAHQVHKADVRVVNTGGLFTQTDAFVSNEPGMALAIQVADCAAVLLGDDVHSVIGAAHAGWRGAVAGIVPKTISEMIKLGADPKNIKTFISPCISLKHFEVGEEVAEQFPARFVDNTSFKKPHLDLKAYIKEQLRKQEIPDKNIITDVGCTLSEEQFYSYRRQKEKSGRMMGIIKLNK